MTVTDQALLLSEYIWPSALASNHSMRRSKQWDDGICNVAMSQPGLSAGSRTSVRGILEIVVLKATRWRGWICRLATDREFGHRRFRVKVGSWLNLRELGTTGLTRWGDCRRARYKLELFAREKRWAQSCPNCNKGELSKPGRFGLARHNDGPAQIRRSKQWDVSLMG